MVATKVLISLCMASVAVAAPQLALPGLQRTTTYTTNSVDEGQIVTNVVTALQPSIAQAVANALRSVQSTTVGFSSGATSLGGAAFSSKQVANSGSSFSSSSQSASGSTGSSFGSGSVAAEAEVTARPEYNYEFKVANNEEQTYISQQEARDGDELTGTYSYVDANGDLVTVNYQAGVNGFSQTTDKQEGFVDVSARPVRVATATSSTAAANSGSSASRFSGATSSTTSSSNSGSRFSAGATSGLSGAVTTTSSIDQSALINQIVLALQPQIATSVSSALSAQQAAAASAAAAANRRTTSALSQTSSSSVRAGDASAIFGDGYNVRIATPEFNIEY